MGTKQNSQNVTFSKPFADADRSGYIWVAPAGTTLPTDATTALAATYVGLGYISEDGLTEPAALELADGIVAAGGDTVAQGDPTFNKTWTGTCIEALNIDMLKTAYGTARASRHRRGRAPVRQPSSPFRHGRCDVRHHRRHHPRPHRPDGLRVHHHRLPVHRSERRGAEGVRGPRHHARRRRRVT